MATITAKTLKRLAELDAPTVANAIESFQVRDATSGFASMDLKRYYPENGSMTGYAVTVTSDTTTPAPPRESKTIELFEAIAAAPKPVVVVIKDISTQRSRSCHAGDVLATIFHRLGAVGLVTDGGVRDIKAIEERVPGFHVFASGLVVAHGIPTFVEIGPVVTLCGLTIKPGDLLHGDENGLQVIPAEIAEQVPGKVDEVHQRESELEQYVHSDEFNIEGLRLRLKH